MERYRDSSVRDAVADFVRRGMRELIVLGTPTEAAEQIEAIVGGTDLDGFNFTPFVSPGSYEEFGGQVVPELQRMGLGRTERRDETFRERLFGQGRRRVPASHRAQRFGWAATEPVDA